MFKFLKFWSFFLKFSVPKSIYFLKKTMFEFSEDVRSNNTALLKPELYIEPQVSSAALVISSRVVCAVVCSTPT